MNRLHGVVIFGLAIGACGGGSGDSDVSIDDLPGSVADTECGIQAQCEEAPDVASCKATFQTMSAEIETIIADVKAGTVKYDAAKYGACVDEQKAANCAFTGFHTDSSTDPCSTYLTGTVAMGGACFYDLECANHANCTPTSSSCDPNTACCAGTCGAGSTSATPVAVGGTCSSTMPCDTHGYCKQASGAATGTCTALVTTAGAACDSFDACAGTMICNETSSTGGTCYQPGAEGATCDPTFFVADFACLDGRDYCDPTMKKCIARVAVGATCSDTILCQGLATCVNAKCVANGAAGAACDSQQTTAAGCLGSLSCTNSVCTEDPSGAACH